MKIELEIPDWAANRRLVVLGGIELLARKDPNDKWKIKTSRCSQCGACCRKLKCEHLEWDGSEYKCGFRGGRPYDCTVSVGWLPECTEKLEYGE